MLDIATAGERRLKKRDIDGNEKAPSLFREDSRTSIDSRGDKNRATAAVKKPAKKEKEPQPGYCENCREKFNDFEEVCILL
jgi:hypothetical protein